MKKIIAALIVVTLSGCAVIDKVSEMWPRDHDPGLFSAYINLKVSMENADCEKNKYKLGVTVINAHWLNAYTQMRSDPQRSTTLLIEENLKKAEMAENPAVCKRWYNLANINMKSLQKAWGDR